MMHPENLALEADAKTRIETGTACDGDNAQVL
jgi:hypothetical protein